MLDMTLAAEISRPFEPGTTGWSVEDLDSPEYEGLWLNGHYEIIEGVLTKMPAAYADGAVPLGRLQRNDPAALGCTWTAGRLRQRSRFCDLSSKGCSPRSDLPDSRSSRRPKKPHKKAAAA